ncbi:hypothetical protein SAV31267_097280 [Streptomyces avermitilis]|uniref:Uncharacterized protein n=1 Tax=Streptomyces avermitilis TaxID=33903 RepID=A0A4D4N714_STRAX|nr:hypothetical protein SAV31267_097280 [Streptomyces avermitilis]
MGVGPQPAGDIDGQDQPAVGSPWQWDFGQCPPQPAGIDASTGQGGVEAAMASAVFTHQRQLGQRPHRSVATQNGIGQLEQRVRTSGQTGVELAPEA